jgi:hypothetical protein
MTKFDELCETAEHARSKGGRYREAAIDFAQTISGAIFKFLEAPDGRLCYISIETGKPTSPFLALKVNEADRSFKFLLGIDLQKSNTSLLNPLQKIIVAIFLKKSSADASEWSVKMSEEGEWRKIPVENHEKQLDEFAEIFFLNLQTYYTDSLDKYLSGEGTEEQGRIGFS